MADHKDTLKKDGNETAEASTKKMVLDALGVEPWEEDNSIGKPRNPVLPLVGSLNVPISEEEEKKGEYYA